MNTPEELSSDETDETKAVEAPLPPSEAHDRITDILNLEVALGIPSGGNRDPWSIGGVQPRWPQVRPPLSFEADGEVLGTYELDPKTLEITYTPVDRQPEQTPPEGRVISSILLVNNADGSFHLEPHCLRRKQNNGH